MGLLPALERCVTRVQGELAPAADYNLRILWTLARYVEDTRGTEALARVAAAGGIDPDAFDDKNRWVGAGSFEAILAAARAVMENDDEFKLACVHRLREAYGPLRYVLWTTSVGAVFQAAAKQFALVCRCGEMSVSSLRATSGHLTVTSRVPFTRLNCLVRHAQCAALPTLWGLPPAHLREHACMGRGDPSCELTFHWYAGRRWMPVALGAVVAALVGLLLVRFGVPSVPTPMALGLLGATLGYLFEVRRAERVNEHTRREVMEALRAMAFEESQARHELLEMHDRQKGWTRLVEEEMTARAATSEKLTNGLKNLQEARATTLLGFSHDLRNPLQIIKMSVEYLKTLPALTADPDANESLRDVNLCADRMRAILEELVQATKAQRDFVTMAPRKVETQELADSLRRRLRALVYGTEVRSTVLSTRDVPAELTIDPVALDRIVDNLLTNAAKYTERGSVVVELDGRPGFLVAKVSDTGRGIEAGALERIFEPGATPPESRRGDSHGVGLSVVAQLLDQMGGRIEVMSRPSSGTTFWVYLPVEPGTARQKSFPSSRHSTESRHTSSARVVTIRKQATAE